eukprot:TRINITY_DN5619_c0_g3_i7.p1 TRINITY_DN5619_c0_g3~~TRINITY_DN5619_c0_g3_i7.p1  ORF type:complete len:383 (-),score=69.40 TRINITY_DN5619_c0_g3_i7:367-1515(-)
MNCCAPLLRVLEGHGRHACQGLFSTMRARPASMTVSTVTKPDLLASAPSSASVPQQGVGAESSEDRPGSKRAQKKADKKALKAALKEGQQNANASGRKGPSGQDLKGPTQNTTAVEVSPSVLENPLQTPSIEAENVHQVYDTIADHWNHTRYKMWPRVEEFLRSLPYGSIVADLGCGNGKNVPGIRESGSYAVASDMCAPLVQIAHKEFGVCGMVADCLNTPFKSGGFDAAISIAVLHHLSTEPRRVQAIREAARLLKPGGKFLVYCWSYEQDDEKSRSRHRFVAQDVLVPWSFRTPGIKKEKQEKKPKTKNGKEAASNDGAPAGESKNTWDEEAPVCQRYCHVYCEGELDKLFAQVPELEVLEIYFDTGNWCGIARRRPDV